MEKYKIEANEAYFTQILSTLNEGGVYGFVAARQFFIKKGDKLTGSAEALSCVRDIVSEPFFKKHFALRV